ncbi:DEAD/DEAH box helicase domain-containing protein [Cardiosporidium cionae]|uniref:ATP-dependent RNA helicase n=1 Tax=Cardiosporidium cionae TaxID=476202 RepID=A0ABQ7J899_9APIC|nr:DEAD/DEAH box helicase domain-containing protein [Cardiosporidium cionae]|eukprot:KAF8820189.1 DEAD/DEAH box helicase domain-containing protein [Cardiosporidium cionae]
MAFYSKIGIRFFSAVAREDISSKFATLHPQIVSSLKQKHVTALTENQLQAFKAISKGLDTLIHSSSGSGKTFAYLLPFVDKIYKVYDAAFQRIHSIEQLHSTPITENKTNTSGLQFFQSWCDEHLRDTLQLDEDHRNKTLRSKGFTPTQFAVHLLDRYYKDKDSNITIHSNYHHILTNPLQSIRPWIVLTPNRDLVAQVTRALLSLDQLNRISIQNLTDLSIIEEDSVGQDVGEDLSLNVMETPIDSTAKNPLISSLRIRWGAVDIVITTPQLFVSDMRRFRSEEIYPSCIVLDEVDWLLHDNTTRGAIMDIFEYIRPRLPIKLPDEPKPRVAYFYIVKDLAPCQFVHVCTTLPSMGPTTAGAMITERFCNAEEIVSSAPHKLLSHVKHCFIRCDTNEKIQTEQDVEAFASNTQYPAEIHLNKEDFLWKQRQSCLIQCLKSQAIPGTLIFCNTLSHCKRIFGYLKQHQWPVVSYHKDMSIVARDNSCRSLASGNALVMVATDLASRGIDFKNVNHVINFEFPTDAVAYIHRAGRVTRGNVEETVAKNTRAIAIPVVTSLMGTEDTRLGSQIVRLYLSDKSLQSTFSRKRSYRTRLLRRYGSLSKSSAIAKIIPQRSISLSSKSTRNFPKSSPTYTAYNYRYTDHIFTAKSSPFYPKYRNTNLIGLKNDSEKSDIGYRNGTRSDLLAKAKVHNADSFPRTNKESDRNEKRLDSAPNISLTNRNSSKKPSKKFLLQNRSIPNVNSQRAILSNLSSMNDNELDAIVRF